MLTRIDYYESQNGLQTVGSELSELHPKLRGWLEARVRAFYQGEGNSFEHKELGDLELVFVSVPDLNPKKATQACAICGVVDHSTNGQLSGLWNGRCAVVLAVWSDHNCRLPRPSLEAGMNRLHHIPYLKWLPVSRHAARTAKRRWQEWKNRHDQHL